MSKKESRFCYFIFNEILDILQFLHEKNIAHQNMNPKAIFIENGEIKLGEFGFAA